MDALRPADPSIIGDFKVLGRLGAGGMGLVYLGVTRTGRPVALKVIHAEIAADLAFRARFEREVAAARRVGGFWTAGVVAADTDAEIPWLATEYIPGPSLREAVAIGGPLPVAAATLVAGRLAEAVAAIHAAGLVHRDLKPANVLMSPDGPVVIDFGIARPFSTDSAHLTAVIGTPSYMAPEQIRGEPLGPASDVFSLGAIMTYALTGRGPFDVGAAEGVVHRVLTAKPNLATVPWRLHDLILACLAKKPTRRPTVGQLIDALASASARAEGPYGGWQPPPVDEQATISFASRAGLPTTKADQHEDATTLPDSDPPTSPANPRRRRLGRKKARRSREGEVLAANIELPLGSLTAVLAMLFPFGALVAFYLLVIPPTVTEEAREGVPARKRDPRGRVGPATFLFASFRAAAFGTAVVLMLIWLTLLFLLAATMAIVLTTGVLGPFTSWWLGDTFGLPREWFIVFFIKLVVGLPATGLLEPESGSDRDRLGTRLVTRVRDNASEFQLIGIWLLGIVVFVGALLALPSLGWWPLPYGR